MVVIQVPWQGGEMLKFNCSKSSLTIYWCLKPSAITDQLNKFVQVFSQSEMQTLPVCFSVNSFSLGRSIARSWKRFCFCLIYANTLKLIPQFRKQQMKNIPVILHSRLRNRKWELFFPPSSIFVFRISSLTSTRFFGTKISFPKKI